MSKLPFIVAEDDLGVRLARIMCIIYVVSSSPKSKSTITSHKLAIYDFLVKNPHVLQSLIMSENGNVIQLLDIEVENIGFQFPNRTSLMNPAEIKGYVQILLHYSFLESVSLEELGYVATKIGSNWINTLQSQYIYRVKELSRFLVPLTKYSTQQLFKRIHPFLKGV